MKKLIAAMILGILMGCELEVQDNFGSDTVTVIGTGDIVTKAVELSSFRNISMAGVAQVKVTKGSPQSVVIRAQQNILDVMKFEVVNEEFILSLKNNTNIRVSEDIEADIIVPEIDKIALRGAGGFELSGSKQNKLDINLNGAGDVMAFNLEVDTCNITITGVGDCKVQVNSLLNVLITGVGDVFYKGNPVINSAISGEGNIINAN